ncbi:MAG: ATP-binding protein [Chitinispirillaceae bacterium]|nr:ATP-binding protein [Chitinispirillaceae bacterium]
MNYINRDLEETLSSFLKSDRGKHIILFSGARQTGKSTLMEYLPCPEKKIIINLWDEEREILALRKAPTFSEFEHILKTVFRFTPGGNSVLIIDEAQASEYIGLFIMEMQRKWRGQKVILLGSLLANLYKKGQPMPAGRTVEFICRPLNFREFLRFGGKEHLYGLVNNGIASSPDIHHLFMDEYRHYLQIGGLPGIVAAYHENGDLPILFESLMNHIYRDADRVIDPSTGSRQGRIPQYGRILETAMKSIACHIGSPTQNATLLSPDSPAYRTVLPHVLEALNIWHLVYTLPLQTAQVSTKKGYSSKKYLFDTGIANFIITRLMPVRFGEGDQTAAMLLENGILQDCISCVESINAIQCYRSNNRVPTELDFIVTLGGKSVPIEVKSSASIKLNTISQLMEYLERTDKKEGYVVVTGLPETKEFRGKTIRLIPPYMLLEVLRNR